MDWQDYHRQFQELIGRPVPQMDYRTAFLLREDELVADVRAGYPRRRITPAIRAAVRADVAGQFTNWYRHVHEHALYRMLATDTDHTIITDDGQTGAGPNTIAERGVKLSYYALGASPAVLWIIGLRLQHDHTPKEQQPIAESEVHHG